MASSKVSSFPYKDKHQSSQLTIGIFHVWFLLIVGLQEVSATVGDPCSTPSACSDPGEICITSTNKCGCSADYYQTVLGDCQPNLASGPVSELMVSSITSDGSQVTWKKPERPNGDITGYTLTVMEGSVCVYGHIISCSDCPTPGPSSNTASCMKTNSESKTSAELNNDTTTLTVEVSDLEPYRNYTVRVTADNSDGIGIASYVSFTTMVAAARDVTGVLATSRRNNGTGVVSLTVTWTPGYFTGPTNYEVTLEEETSLGSGSFKVIAVNTITGYDNTTWANTSVLAYWIYRINVKAMTAAGNSSVVGPRAVRTATTTPGLPQAVTVEQDETVAQELALTITCPEEKERNGIITGYIIRKTFLASSGVTLVQESEYVVDADSSRTCTDTYTAKDVGGINVEQNYTFEVKVKNTDFSGSFSSQSSLYAEPKAPRFEEIMTEYKVSSLVRQHDGSTKHQTEIDVSVCASCLLDNRQGTVERVGLVVFKVDSDGWCIDGGRKRRSLVNIRDYTTWSTARSQSFRVPYRATPDEWIFSLRSPNTSYPYRIGTDRNCRTDADTVYCNGPLPSDTSFRVAVIQCNSAGCVIGTFEGPFRTGPDDSENATLPIALGVVIPVVIIIAIIIIVVAIKRKQSKQDTREEDQRPYNTMNTTMSDAHLYHGVTGRTYVSPTYTNPNGQDNIAMVGLHRHHASLQQRDDTEYTEPDHYDYIHDNSENQP